MVIIHYYAEALRMDSDEVAESLGIHHSILEALKRCERHNASKLEFKTKTSGIWKAQGITTWYRVKRLEEKQ